ncbi:MAG TPA: ABC transporter substrate-binding protein [Actinomycetota bacterium]|nr:ABC transporter substrate-binding protein [Actinomycetota bacterium]
MKRPMKLMAVSLACLALVLGACAKTTTGTNGSPSASVSATATKNPTIAAEVPAAIASKGSLIVAADATYPPMEFFPVGNNSMTGVDVDLGHAIGTVLGLQFNFTNATFATIIPGLKNGRYDIGMSSFTDDEGSVTTKSRLKVVDFVTYFSAGTGFYEKPGGPNVTGLDNSLCGLTVGVEAGTTQEADATAQSPKCTQAGKKKVTVNSYPDQTKANTALASGRVQVVMADSETCTYAVKQSAGTFASVGPVYGSAPYGVAIPKRNSSLDQAILDAIKELMSNGVYAQILAKWGVTGSGINDPVIHTGK